MLTKIYIPCKIQNHDIELKVFNTNMHCLEESTKRIVIRDSSSSKTRSPSIEPWSTPVSKPSLESFVGGEILPSYLIIVVAKILRRGSG